MDVGGSGGGPIHGEADAGRLSGGDSASRLDDRNQSCADLGVSPHEVLLSRLVGEWLAVAREGAGAGRLSVVGLATGIDDRDQSCADVGVSPHEGPPFAVGGRWGLRPAAGGPSRIEALLSVGLPTIGPRHVERSRTAGANQFAMAGITSHCRSEHRQ